MTQTTPAAILMLGLVALSGAPTTRSTSSSGSPSEAEASSSDCQPRHVGPSVTSGDGGDQNHRYHRGPGTRPVISARFFA
jgi:hypothetical protein